MKKIFIFSILILAFSCKTSTTNNNIDRIKNSGYGISPGATSLADVIVGKFPGVKVEGANMINSTTRFIIRGGTMSMNAPAGAFIDIVPPRIINLVVEFIILAPSTFTPGNFPTITSAKEVAPGEIPYPEFLILSILLFVVDVLQLNANIKIENINIFFMINFL